LELKRESVARVGVTVSLLIGELAFGADTQRDEHVTVAVLLGSLLAAIITGLLLRSRNRIYDRIAQQETDGRPEAYPPLSRGDRRRTDYGCHVGAVQVVRMADWPAATPRWAPSAS